MTLDGVTYFYLLDATGEIMGLLDEDGNRAVEYICEGYGKSMYYNTSSTAYTLGHIDPLCYRGYVYDYGTGLYYLQSRSYNYTTGRFINADAFVSTGQGILGNNMFAYCLNNPVMLVDPTGHCSYLGSIHAPKQDCGNSQCPDSYAYIIDLTDRLNEAMIAHSLELHGIAEVYGEGAAIYFALKSKKGSEWDLKDKGGWDLDDTRQYRYGDLILREDDIGNIHYGFVGRTLFSLDLLLPAAGVAQILDASSSWAYWYSNFDEPRDQWAIRFGYNLWDEGLKP